MMIGKKLYIPDGTKAVLWDMDGVLIDSLGFDVAMVNKLLQNYFGTRAFVSPKFLKSIFAYDPRTFWQMILKKVGCKLPKSIIQEYSLLRQTQSFKLCPGILTVINRLKQKNIKQAVVSNNPAKEVRRILKNAEVVGRFDLIFGNDTETALKKPTPDTYLLAIKKLGLFSRECVVVEDTEIGVMAGKAAGCYTIGVATGGASKYQLQKMRPKADKIYSSLCL